MTIKDGRVKLADFGVATININLTASESNDRDFSVVGSPYWSEAVGCMPRRLKADNDPAFPLAVAPEVIEQAGASTASDVW